jgi:hypothetical protein
MNELADEIARSAENVCTMGKSRGLGRLDYSEKSLEIVESMLAETAEFTEQLTPDQITSLVEDFGSYILEVGRREFGGRYQWHSGQEQPLLIVGEPVSRIAILPWDKVRGRMDGDKADNIPFFYTGFAERARLREPGDDALYV